MSFLDYFVVGAVVLFLYSVWAYRKPALPLPPGPKPIPILGNALQIPKERPWITYTEWSKTYGDLVHLNALGQHLLIVNSWTAARDLLEKRNALYSNRVHMTFAGDMVGWGRSVAMVEGNLHTQTRRLGQSMMNLKAVQQQYGPRMTTEAHYLLRNLLESPDKFLDHYRGSAGAFIMLTTYGYEAGEDRDRLIHMAKDVVENFSVAATPGNWIVDFIPILRYVPSWVPGFKFNETGRLWRAELEHLVVTPFNKVKQMMAAHTAPPSITSNLLEQNPGTSNEEVIQWLAGSLFAAGADTTVSALASFTLAMTLFPGVQVQARKELDSVVGTERLPTFDDMDRLPYIQAIVKEVLRWAIIVPTGFPHRVAVDDNYNGYLIPANTLVLPNSWAMSRDESVYGPDVEVFRPERFLAMEKQSGYGSAVFGFGPRVCLGQHVAFATLLIQVASILATFEIGRAIGPDGKEIIPFNVGYTSGVVSHPEEFPTVIKPRSKEAVDLIHAAHGFA